MRFKRLIIRFFILCTCATIGYAQNFARDKEDMPVLVREYVKALKTKDRKVIKSAWRRLDRDKQAKVYMQKKLPQLMYSYRMQDIAIRLEELQQSYFDGVLEGSRDRRTPRERPAPSAVGQRTNLERTRSFSNQDRTSNSRIRSTRSNQRRTANSDIRRGFENTDRQSNQRLIRQRIRTRSRR